MLASPGKTIFALEVATTGLIPEVRRVVAVFDLDADSSVISLTSSDGLESTAGDVFDGVFFFFRLLLLVVVVVVALGNFSL